MINAVYKPAVALRFAPQAKRCFCQFPLHYFRKRKNERPDDGGKLTDNVVAP
jgi:hypothetical protein